MDSWGRKIKRLQKTFFAVLWLLLAYGFVGVGLGCTRYTSEFWTLQEALDASAGCLLMVDQSYTGLTELRIPRKTRIMGSGPQGNFSLSFSNLMGSSITIDTRSEPPNRNAYVIIENLAITGPNEGTSIGLDLREANIIYLQNLVIKNFNVGVFGSNTVSVFAENCNVSGNRTANYLLTNSSNSWRIRGGICSQAGRYGIEILLGNNNVIDGVRMESNQLAAIRTNTDSTHITHNRFERNGVLIDTDATATTLISNYYSSSRVTDVSRARSTLRLDNGYAGSTSGFANPVDSQTDLLSHHPMDPTSGPLFYSVPYSPTPEFNAALGSTQKILLSGHVAQSTLVNARAGQTLYFIICQDTHGGYDFTWPENIIGGMTIDQSRGKCSTQSFIFDGATAYALTSGLSPR